jgi:hypothetical protein
MTVSRDALNALSPDDIAARLSGPPEERAAFVRAAADTGLAEAQAVLGASMRERLARDLAGLSAPPRSIM